MIQQSITKYPEFVPFKTTQSNVTVLAAKPTVMQGRILEAHKEREKRKIWIGNKYRMKSNPNITIKITGFLFKESEVMSINGEPAIMMAQRYSNLFNNDQIELTYTLEELDEMEKV